MGKIITDDQFADLAASYGRKVFKFGTGLVGTVLGPMWDGGGGVYQGFNLGKAYSTLAYDIDLVSTSAEDNPLGNGCTLITVNGIGDDERNQSWTGALNGLTIVNTGLLWRAVFRVEVFTQATVTLGQANLGDITATSKHPGGTTGKIVLPAFPLLAKVLVGLGKTQMAMVKTPADEWGELTGLQFTADSAKIMDFRVYGRTDGLAWTQEGNEFILADIYDLDFTERGPRLLPPNTWFVMMASVTSGSAVASSNFTYERKSFDGFDA